MSFAEEALQGTVTVLFTDVEGSTGLGERAGDEHARKVMKVHDEVVRAAVARHAGREVKSLGDGLMAAFNSTRRAVSCAVDIQCDLQEQRVLDPSLLPVRIGVNAGEVLEEEGDLFGSAVSAAARICAKAKGGEILVSEVVKALAGNVRDVSFHERGRFRLKGFEERWRLFQVSWQQKEVAAPLRFDRTPFVARDQERTQLRTYLDAAAAGGGTLVTVGGEPGVGKTRLCEELLEEARRRGMRTLVGRCYELDAPPSYGPFVEVLDMAAREVDRDTFRAALGDAAGEIAKVMPHLRTMFDDIPAALDLPPEQERRYLFNSIAEFVTRAASTTPLVVLLDDLHWADEPSLLLLQQIAQLLPTTPLVLLATYRDVELDVARPLASVLDNLVRQRLATRVTLRRLDAVAVAGMLQKLSGRRPPGSLVDAIYRETDGNPFFVEEVYKHLAEEGRLFDAAGNWRGDLTIDELEVPEGVRLVIGRRLQRLSEPTRRALTVAAVIGRTFSFQLLEAVGEVEGDELLDAVDEADQAGLLVEIGDRQHPRFSFVHELIRQTLLSGVALPRRLRFHLRVAAAMERLYADDLSDHAAELAHHYFHAGAAADPAITTRYLALAGERSIKSAAFEDALRFYEDALRLADEAGPEQADLLYGVGLSQRSLGRLDEAVTTWRDALAAYEAGARFDRMGYVAAEIAVELAWAARWEEAVEAAARALGALPEDAHVERGRLLALTALAMSWSRQYEAARSILDQAYALAAIDEDPGLAGQVMIADSISRYAFVDDLDEAARLGIEGCARLAEAGEAWARVNGLLFALFVFEAQGRMRDMADLLPELEELGARLGHAGALVFAGRIRIFMLLQQGAMVEEWEDLARRDLELCESNELPWLTHSHSILASAAFARGEAEPALEEFHLSAEIEPPGALWGWSHSAYLRALAHAGKTEEAMALWRKLEEWLPPERGLAPLGSWYVLWLGLEALWVLGDRDKAAHLVPLAARSLDLGFDLCVDGTIVKVPVALAFASTGEWDRAHELFGDAFRMIDELPLLGRRANVARLYAQVLLAEGNEDRRGEAYRLLEEAVADFDARGQAGEAASTRTLLDDARTEARTP